MTLSQYSKPNPFSLYLNSSLSVNQKPRVIKKVSMKEPIVKTKHVVDGKISKLNGVELKAYLKTRVDKAFIQLQSEKCTLYVDNIATCQQDVKDIRNEVMYAIRQAATTSKSHVAITECDIFAGMVDDDDGHHQRPAFRACVQFKEAHMVQSVLRQRFPPVLNGVAMGVRSWYDYSQSDHAVLDNVPQTLVTDRAICVDDIPLSLSQSQLPSFMVHLLQKAGRGAGSLVHCRFMEIPSQAYVEFLDRGAADEVLELVGRLQSSAWTDNTYNSLIKTVTMKCWRTKQIVSPFFVNSSGDLIKLALPSAFPKLKSNSVQVSYVGKTHFRPIIPKPSIDDETLSSCPSLKDDSVSEQKTPLTATESFDTSIETISKDDSAAAATMLRTPGLSMRLKSPENMTVQELSQAFTAMQHEIGSLKTEVMTLKTDKAMLQHELEDQCSIMADDQVQIYKELHKERSLRKNNEEKYQEQEFVKELVKERSKRKELEQELQVIKQKLQEKQLQKLTIVMGRGMSLQQLFEVDPLPLPTVPTRPEAAAASAQALEEETILETAPRRSCRRTYSPPHLKDYSP